MAEKKMIFRRQSLERPGLLYRRDLLVSTDETISNERIFLLLTDENNRMRTETLGKFFAFFSEYTAETSFSRLSPRDSPPHRRGTS